MGGSLSLTASRSELVVVAGRNDRLVLLFAALTAILLQILSNLANDYGDFKKGTDNTRRVGPQREMQSGSITEKEMQRGLIATVLLCLVCGGLLLLTAMLAHGSWRVVLPFAVLDLGFIDNHGNDIILIP